MWIRLILYRKTIVLSHLVTVLIRDAYDKHARLGLGDENGLLQSEVGEGGTGGVELGVGDQEGKAAGGDKEACGDREDFGEALDGAQGDDIECLSDIFGAGVLYIDICQCNRAGDFAEEGGLLMVGFDEREGDVRSPEFYRNSGEAGAGTEVGYSSSGFRASGFGNGNVKIFYHRGHRGRHRVEREEMACGEEGFAKMASDNFFGIADGGEVDAGIPAKEYIDVRRYVLELSFGKDSRFLAMRLLGMTRV